MSSYLQNPCFLNFSFGDFGGLQPPALGAPLIYSQFNMLSQFRDRGRWC